MANLNCYSEEQLKTLREAAQILRVPLVNLPQTLPDALKDPGTTTSAITSAVHPPSNVLDFPSLEGSSGSDRGPSEFQLPELEDVNCILDSVSTQTKSSGPGVTVVSRDPVQLNLETSDEAALDLGIERWTEPDLSFLGLGTSDGQGFPLSNSSLLFQQQLDSSLRSVTPSVSQPPVLAWDLSSRENGLELVNNISTSDEGIGWITRNQTGDVHSVGESNPHQIVSTGPSISFDVPFDFGCDNAFWGTPFVDPLSVLMETAADSTNTNTIFPVDAPSDPFASVWEENYSTPQHVEGLPTLQGSSAGPIRRTPPAKYSKRKPYNAEDRRQTSETRKTGNCIRCRMNRKRVSFTSNCDFFFLFFINFTDIILQVHS
jgi:hypothetical protein